MNMNYIPQEADILLTGLNPTKQALTDGALFSHDRSLWNILERAGFYSNSSHIPAIMMYPKLVSGQLNTALKIGLADLLPHIDEQHAACVQVEPQFVHSFLEEAAIKKVKRIGLMGEKVIKAFVLEYPHLRFTSIRDYENQLGEIEIDGHTITVFALPFPNNNNIPNKFLYYRNLITNRN
jgi:hypothetical protein